MDSLRDELIKKLLQKTKELGRQVTFSEMQRDETMPNPNGYAYYYGTFDKAAEKVFQMFSNGEELVVFDERVKGVKIVSKKPVITLSPDRREKVMAEIVDIYIKNNGRMPSFRDVKKNHFISVRDYEALRAEAGFCEKVVRKMAEAKTGKTFLTPNERRRRDRLDRKQMIERMDGKKQLQTEEGIKLTNVAGRRRQVKLTEEECRKALERACRKAGHVITEKEASEQYSGTLPGWTVLQKKLGPWFTWDEQFGLPFIDEKKAAKAMKKKKAYLEKVKAEETSEAPLEANSEDTPPVVNQKIEEVVAEEVKEPDDMVEMPIKLILPKGVKGTVTLTLEF